MDSYITPPENANRTDINPTSGPGATGPLPDLHEPDYIMVRHASAPPPNPSATAHQRTRRGLPALLLAAMLMLSMLFGAGGASAVLLLAGNSTAPITTASAPTTSAPSAAQLVVQADEATINAIYNKLSPSVVEITSLVQGTGRFSSTGQAVGTGMILDKQGNILTNNHVIDGASSIKVTLSDGTEYTATVVGTAPQDDLAVIKANIPAASLVPVELGDSSAVKVGDSVITIGYPYALDQSVSSGIVSGLDRNETSSANGRALSGLIQVDAAINPGNSGGPLVNAVGQVIGVNTMIESPVEGFTGVGMAIPINHAKDLLAQLEAGGQVQRPWIGISGTDITSSLQAEYNLPVSQGVIVMSVTAGGPADQAGLQASTVAGAQSQNPFLEQQAQPTQIGDIIVSIDGHKVSAVTDLTNYLNTKHPGDKVTLGIVRDGSQQNVTVTLQAWPTNTGSAGSTTN
jgi:S1-C subfamily serine protease